MQLTAIYLFLCAAASTSSTARGGRGRLLPRVGPQPRTGAHMNEIRSSAVENFLLVADGLIIGYSTPCCRCMWLDHSSWLGQDPTRPAWERLRLAARYSALGTSASSLTWAATRRAAFFALPR